MTDFSLFPSWLTPSHIGMERKPEKAIPINKVRGRPKNPDNTERDAQFVAHYRSGKTLQEVGHLYGMSRESVRQRLAGMGIKAKDGGAAVRDRWTVR